MGQAKIRGTFEARRSFALAAQAVRRQAEDRWKAEVAEFGVEHGLDLGPAEGVEPDLRLVLVELDALRAWMDGKATGEEAD